MDAKPVIDDIGSPAVARLARLGVRKKYSRKSQIVREGELGQELFVVLAGRVRIYAESQDEHRFVVGTYGPGTLFGEGALDGGPRSASVEAMSEVTCAVLPYAILKQQMAEDSSFAMALLMELVSRSRFAMKRMKSLALDTVYQRLRVLVDAEAEQRDGIAVLGPEWTQQEIANRLGSSRDMITRLFRGLSEGGYIDARRGEIIILKPLPHAY